MRLTEYSGQFRKDLKRVQKRGKDTEKLKQFITLLLEGEPLPERYHDHALTGNWVGARDAHIEGDWLLLYSLLEDESVIRFERTGSHSDLFE